MLRCGPATKGLPLHQIDRPQIVGFKLAARFVDDPASCLQIAFGFEQRLCRQHHFLAGIGQVTRQPDPVGGAQLLPARADDFTDIDDVDRRVYRAISA
jgi:hypothetical protein